MITGDLKNKIDRLWLEFWQGGITNPLTVIEQITYLMFIRLLDLEQTRQEKRSSRTRKPFKGHFSGPDDPRRWGNILRRGSDESLKIVRDDVFPHIKDIAGKDSTFGRYMADATFMINKPALLTKAMELINALPLEKGDIKGDIYEYLLSKLTTAGIAGQFRTPRHIIRMMVDLVEPQLTDRVADPACGTAGFLASVIDHLNETHSSEDGIIVHDDGSKSYLGDEIPPEAREHMRTDMFCGMDFDVSMLRIAAMNMMLHGVDDPDILYADTLSYIFAEQHRSIATNHFDLVLANPPFTGTIDNSTLDPAFRRVAKTRKSELLFILRAIDMLRLGGRCAIIVPQGVLEARTEQHISVRRALVEHNQIDAVIGLPHFVFKPYASVATAVVVFRKGGATEDVWSYSVTNDGLSPDAARMPIDGGELPRVVSLFNARHDPSYATKPGKHGWIDRERLEANDYVLAPRAYLRAQPQLPGEPTQPLSELCNIQRGRVGASKADGGEYPLITSGEVWKSHSSASFDGPAVCVPMVSSTGHGHASIKNIHYAGGKFEAATIVSVLTPKDPDVINMRYLYYYLSLFRDNVLVPLMRGAANVSLSVDELGKVRIPVPSLGCQQALIEDLEHNVLQQKVIQRQLEQLRDEQQGLSEQFAAMFVPDDEVAVVGDAGP